MERMDTVCPGILLNLNKSIMFKLLRLTKRVKDSYFHNKSAACFTQASNLHVKVHSNMEVHKLMQILVNMKMNLYLKTNILVKINVKAGAELCQAQIKLG